MKKAIQKVLTIMLACTLALEPVPMAVVSSTSVVYAASEENSGGGASTDEKAAAEARKKAEEEAAAKKAEEEAKKKAEEEAAAKKAEEEAAAKAASEKAEEEAEKKAADENAAEEAASEKAVEEPEKETDVNAGENAQEEPEKAAAGETADAASSGDAEEADSAATDAAEEDAETKDAAGEAGTAKTDDANVADTKQPAEKADSADTKKSAEEADTAATELPAEEAGVSATEEAPAEEPVEMPAKSFSGGANGVSVTVKAEEGTFPAGTTMKVQYVSSGSVMGAVQDAVEGEVKSVKAVDISFWYKGKEIQPEKPVKVSMSASGMDASLDHEIVHINDHKDGVVETVVEKHEMPGTSGSFHTDSFSIYAIVEQGAVEDDSRLTVKFVKADEKTAEMMITKNQLDHIEQYIYDPGNGEVPDGASFKGWTDNENYDADTESLTIEDVRKAVTAKLNAGVKEGESITYYAMVFNSYMVTYLDEDSVTLKNDRKLYRLNDSGKHEYTVNLAYTPHAPAEDDGTAAVFMGWQQISPETEGETLYQNNETIELTGDIILRAKVNNGYWLTFNENLSGADYTQPEFVVSGDSPKGPAEDPTCAGYEFKGWYTEDASPEERDGQVAGSQVTDFSSLKLEANTTLHAKWEKNGTAKYTVLIWKQRVSGEGYDFEASRTLNGNTGDVIAAVTEAGSGDGRYARVDGENIRYEGFHLEKYDQNVTINAEGNSVLNVYYDRNMITLIFLHRENNGWKQDAKMEGLYGSTLESNGYTWPTNRWWYDDYEQGWGGYSGSGTRTTFLDAFILAGGESSQTFYGFNGNGTNTIHFLKQNADKNGYTEASAVTTSGGTFYISDKFSGYHAASYSTDNRNWTDLGDKDSDGYYASVQRWGSNLYIRFDREEYSILFKDGSYRSSSGDEEANKSGETLGQVDKITFGADVSSYKNYKDTDRQQHMQDYVFTGWYADEACTSLYDFKDMPEGGIVVYAGWKKKDYTVILHNNAGEDSTFTYSSESQEEKFWVDNGEKIGNVGGERLYYDLVGWYVDEDLTKVYDFDAFVINDGTIKTMGKMYSDSEISADYPNTVGELNLYAKWRSKLIGANGINIVYNPDGGTDEPEDEMLYVDQSEAIAYGGSKPASDDMVFSHWIVQKWNGSKFVDAGETVFAGDTFVVKADDARITDNNNGGAVITRDKLDKNGSYTYTIELKAAYVEKDKESRTHINFYNNYDGGTVEKYTDIGINEAKDIPAAPSREGYEFKGWIRDVEKESGKTNSTDVWLEYDGSKYTLDGRTVKQVAADELLVGENQDQYHALYAMWEAKDVDYTVEFYYQNVDDDEYKKDDSLTDTRQAKTDSTVKAVDADKDQTKDGTYQLVSGEPSVLSATVKGDGSTVLKLYFELCKRDVTVHHYLKGTTTKVADDVIAKDLKIGAKYKAEAAGAFLDDFKDAKLTADSYDPKQEITVSKDGNEITVYYTIELTVKAETKSKAYDGKPLVGQYTVEGALDADKDTINKALGDAPSITEVSESPKEYLTKEDQEKITGIPEYYKATYTPGKLTITKSEIDQYVTLTTVDVEKTYDGNAYTAGTAKATDKNGKTVKIEYQNADGNWTENPAEITATNVADSIETINVRASVESSYEGYVTGTQKLVIKQREVKVTGDGWNSEQPYTGSEYKKTTYTFDNVVSGEKAEITYEIKGTEVGSYTGEFKDDFKVMKGETDTTENYTLTQKTPGTLTITKSEIAQYVTLEPADVEKTYDGKTYTAGTAIATDKNGKTVKVEYEKADGSWTENPAEITATNVADSIETINVRASVESSYEGYVTGTQKLVIKQREVTVTGDGWNSDQPYTGEEYKKDTYTFDNVVDGETASITYEIKGTEVGSYTGEFKDDFKVMKGEKDTTANYTLTEKTPGTLTITKSEIAKYVTLDTEDVEKTYDGTTYTAGTATATDKNGKTVKIEYQKADGSWTEDPAEITATNVSDSIETINVRASVESSYEGYVTGTQKLVIKQREVTVVGDGWNSDQPYTGEEYKKDTYTFDNVVDGETASITYEIKGTEVGPYTGTFGDDFKVMKGETDTTANYKLTEKTPGTLTITKSEIAKYVTLEPVDVEETYDGTAYPAGTATATDKNGKTVKIEYQKADGSWTEDPAEITATNVADSLTAINVRASVDSSYEGYVNGTQKLVIKQREVTVTGDGWDSEQTYTGEEYRKDTYTFDNVVEGETASITYEVKGTDAGSYTGTFGSDFKVMKGETETTANYKLTDKTPGTLTINQKAITVKAKDATKVYDATALKAEDAGYEITDGELVEGETEEVVLSGEQTLVGSSPAKVDSVVIKKGDADVTKNYKIEMADGTLTVTDGTDPEDEKPVDDDLVVTKTVDDKEYKLGETVTFAVTATNVYAEAKDITLTEIDGVTLETAVFEAVEPGATVETTATYVITEADILAGEFKNTVTAEVGNVTKKAEATAKTEAKNGHLTIEKVTTSETPETGYPLGDTIDYKITVKNDGNLTITDIYVTDELTGDQWMIKSMKPGESKDYEASYTVTEADVLAGEVVNVATGKGTSPDPEKPDVPVEPGKDPEPTEEMNGHLTVNKVTTSETPEGGYMVGDKVEYKITVTNDGNLTITDITVKDDLTGDEWELEFLEPGESKDYEASYTVTEDDAEAGKVENVATAKGTSPDPEKPDVPVENGKVTVPVGSEELALIYNITYKLNGGVYDGSTEDIVEQYPDGTVISIHEAPTREGYVFDYWKGSEYQPGDKYTVTGDHVFVAQWKEAEKEKTPAKKHSKSEDSDDDDSSPRTGDDNHAGLWILLLLAAAAGTLGASIYRKKNRK